MERYVVFTHELIQLDFFWILPPFLPVRSKCICDGKIPNGGIEPYIKYFVSKSFERNWSSPFKIPSNASSFKSFL